MQEPRDVAARRLSMIIEQYVEARKRHYGFVSTDQAAMVIRKILKPTLADPALTDRQLDDMVAALAVKNGLAVIFDRGARGSAIEADLNRKEPTMRAPTEILDVVGAVDAILRGQIAALSMSAIVSLLRERTGTKRSDADLEGLIAKKAAVLDVHLSRSV
ncbi:hypothetical protein [Mesorhizobium loti]|nr:hypothetical protein [Mesorhizobium loti]